MPWAEDVPQPQPTLEYIADAGTATEDAWAREEARYRAKNDREQQA